MDFLIGDFLQDLLVVINAELDKKLAKSKFDPTQGFKEGYDPETKIRFFSEPTYIIIREDEGNYIELRLDKDYTYNITLKQNDIGVEDVQLGGDGVNQITINQIN